MDHGQMKKCIVFRHSATSSAPNPPNLTPLPPPPKGPQEYFSKNKFCSKKKTLKFFDPPMNKLNIDTFLVSSYLRDRVCSVVVLYQISHTLNLCYYLI